MDVTLFAEKEKRREVREECKMAMNEESVGTPFALKCKSSKREIRRTRCP
jgi:hypothetical protein